ncbi:MAG: hypothetical protein OHK0012_25920 [Synechococcales cyanobacterium]
MLLTIPATTAVTVALPPAPVYAQSVSTDWTELYAQALARQNYPLGTQQPLSATLTRVELAQWLTRFFNYSFDPSRAQAISDVPTTNPDHGAVQAVLQAGVMRLFDGNQFRPTGNLTRLETLAILVRVLQVPAPSQADVDRWLALYSDAAEVPSVGRPFIAMAGQANLLVNVPDPRRLTPNAVLRRGDGAVLLHQALVYQQKIAPLSPPVAQVSLPTPAPTAAITALRLSPESGTVSSGSPLTIEVEGTPRSQVTATIDNRINVPLTEVQPGVYRSTYTIGPSDSLANPAISVQLTAASGSTRIQRQFPQLSLGSVATLPPPVTPFNPTPTFNPPPSTTSPLFTGIRLRPERDLRAGEILTVQIWGVSGGVAQFDVGNLARNQPMREISPNLYEGTYVVAETHRENNPRLAVILTAGGRSDQYQQLLPFSIDGGSASASPISTAPPLLPLSPPAPVASSLRPQIMQTTSTSSNRILRTNDVLTVTMRGDAGGRATFQIVNLTPEVFMQELSPGYYEGKVSIASTTPAISNGVLQFALERNGQRTTQQFPDPVNISP